MKSFTIFAGGDDPTAMGSCGARDSLSKAVHAARLYRHRSLREATLSQLSRGLSGQHRTTRVCLGTRYTVGGGDKNKRIAKDKRARARGNSPVCLALADRALSLVHDVALTENRRENRRSLITCQTRRSLA